MATLLGFGDDIRKKNNLIPNRFQQSKVVTNYGQAAPAVQPNIQSVNKTPTPNTSSAKNSVSSRAAGTLRSLSNFNVDRPMPNTQQTSLNVQNISTNKPVENNFKTIQSKQSQGILERGPWGQNGPTTNNPIPSINTLSNANFNAPINNASKDPLAQTNILNAQLSDGKTINQNRYNNLLSKIAERENKKASDASYDKWLKNADEETMLGQATKAIENGDKDWLQRVVNKSDVAKTSSKLRDLLTNDAARINFNSRYNVNFTPEEYAKATSKYDLSKYTSENSAPQSFLDKQIKKVIGGTNTDTLENDVNEAMRLINRAKQYGDADAAKLEYSGNREDLVKAYQLINTLANLSEMYGVENLGIGGYNARQLNDLINDASKRSTSAEVNSPFLSAETIGEFGKQIGEFGQQVADRIDEFGAKNLGPVSDIQRFLVTLPTGSAEAMLSSPNNLAMGAVEFGNSNKNIQDFAKLAGTMVNEGINLMPLLEIGGSGALLGSGKRLAKDIAAGNITKQAASDTARRTLGTVLKDIFKDAAQEGIEEGVQYIAEKLGEDGNFDNFKFEELAQNVLGGAAGGAVMSGMSTAIDEYARPVISNLVNSFKENGIGLSVKDVSQDNLTAGKSIKNTNQDTSTNINTAKTKEDALNTLEEVGLTEQQAMNNRGEFLDLYRKGIKTESDFNNEVYKKDGSVKKKYSEYDVDTLQRLFRANDALFGGNQTKSEIKTEQSLKQNEQKIANQMNGEAVDAEQKVRTPEEITRDLDRAYADLDAGYGDEAKIRQLENELDAARAEQGNPEFYSDDNNVEKVEPKTEETPESLMEQLNEETAKPDKQQDKKKIKQLTEKLNNLIENPETNNQVEIENENKVSGTEELPNNIKVSKPAEETAQRLREEPLKVETEIPVGDQNIKVEETVEPADDGMRKSNFANRVSNNEKYSEDTRASLKDATPTYRQGSNAEQIAYADDYIAKNGIDKSYDRVNSLLDGKTVLSGEDAVLAQKVIDYYAEKGDVEKSSSIMDRLSMLGTSSGQMNQSMRVFNSVSPAAIVNHAKNTITKSGGTLTQEVSQALDNDAKTLYDIKNRREQLAKDWQNTTDEISKLREEQAALKKEKRKQDKIVSQIKELKEHLKETGKMISEADLSKAEVMSSIAEKVTKNSKDTRTKASKASDAFGSIYRAFMLSGPKTHTANFLSNSVNYIGETFANSGAAAIDAIVSKLTGKQRTSASTLRGRGSGFAKGLKDAARTLKTGNSLWSSMGKRKMEGTNEIHINNKVLNTLVAKPTNFVFRAMEAGDLAFRWSAYEASLREGAAIEAKNKGLKGEARADYIDNAVSNPSNDLQTYAMNKANRYVYDYDTGLNNAITGLRNSKFGRNPAGKVVLDIAAPFVKVPSAVVSTALDWSPVGALEAITRFAVKQDFAGNSYGRAEFQRDLVKSATGTLGLIPAGMALAAAGAFTGEYPEKKKDESDEDFYNRLAEWNAKGYQANSIIVGDKQISVDNLGPAASFLLNLGRGIHENLSEGKDVAETSFNAITGAIKSAASNSALSNMGTAIGALTGEEDIVSNFASSFAQSLVPALSRQTAQATDEYDRQTTGDNLGETMINRIKAGIPGLRQTLDAKVDNYGEKMENTQALPLGDMYDPLKIANLRNTDNKSVQEVERLNKSVGENATPSSVATIKYDDTSYKLTTEQKVAFREESGKAKQTAMEKVMNMKEYSQLTDMQKAKALEYVQGKVEDQMKENFAKANNFSNGENPGTKNAAGTDKIDFASIASKAIGNAKNYGEDGKSKVKSGRSVDINSGTSKETQDILNKYQTMTSDEWDKYKKENNSAEYDYAKAKFENDKANGKLTQAQIVNKEAELKKLSVSKDYSYDIRDAYSLAGTRSKMQALLNTMDEETRASTVNTLNSLNRAMYDAGVISASTYKTRKNAINNTTSSGSRGGRSSIRPAGTISSEEMSTLNKLAKALSETNPIKVGSNAAPANNISTARKMQQTKLSNGRKQSYGSSSKISVKKGIA